jgi:hypothetical protein
MSKVNLKVRDKGMAFCLLLFIVSVVVASFEQKVAIILLIASSGVFILIGLLQGSRNSRSANPCQRKVMSNKGQLFLSTTVENNKRCDISIFPWWWQPSDALSDCCESLLMPEDMRCFDC